MNHVELQVAAAAALFASFLAGWLAGWLVRRAGPPAAAVPPQMPDPRPDFRPDPALAAAQADLREAQIEIEELRAYIDRKLAQRP